MDPFLFSVLYVCVACLKDETKKAQKKAFKYKSNKKTFSTIKCCAFARIIVLFSLQFLRFTASRVCAKLGNVKAVCRKTFLSVPAHFGSVQLSFSCVAKLRPPQENFCFHKICPFKTIKRRRLSRLKTFLWILHTFWIHSVISFGCHFLALRHIVLFLVNISRQFHFHLFLNCREEIKFQWSACGENYKRLRVELWKKVVKIAIFWSFSGNLRCFSISKWKTIKSFSQNKKFLKFSNFK